MDEQLFEFLMELLQAVRENPTPEFIYPILESKKQYLNPTLAELLQSWAKAELSQLLSTKPEEAKIKAGVIFSFSELLQEFTLGNPRHNLEISIIGYQAILIVFSSDRFPEYYAMTMHNLAYTLNNLAIYYRKLADIGVEEKSNLQLSIHYFEQAADIRTKLNLEQQISVALHNLDIYYKKLAEISVEEESNLQLSIHYYEQSADIYTGSSFDKNLSVALNNLALTLNNLAIYYRKLADISVEKESNLQLSIHYLKESVGVYTRLNFDEDLSITLYDLSNTLYNLANYYRNLADIGVEEESNLQLSIYYYEQSVGIYTRLNFDEDLSHTLNALGIYQKLDEDLSDTLHNLGYVYKQLADIGLEKEKNLRLSIDHYKQAAGIRTKSNLDEKLSDTLHNLAVDYAELADIGLEKEKNLRLAIDHYKQAAGIRTKLNLDEKFSDTLNDLGSVYRKLADISVEQEKNLRLSIDCHEQSRGIRTKLNLDEKFSDTLNDLGSVYRKLADISVEQEKNLRLSIDCHEQSRGIRTKLNLDEKLSDTLHCLAIDYGQLAYIGLEEEKNLRLAIDYHERAFDIRTKLNLDEEIAHTLGNLGVIYYQLAKIGLDRKNNLQRAIDYYNEAADIYIKFNLYKFFFTTRTDLGNVYCLLAEIGVDEELNRNKAIGYFREALKFFKPNLFPDDCLRAGRDLGRLAFKQREWEIALEGYKPAMTAVEQIRTWKTRDKQRQKVIEDAIDIYNNALHCYITLDDISTAIIIAERSRARYLVDLMATKLLYPNDEIPLEVTEYEAKQREIDQLPSIQKDNDHNFQEKLTQLLQEKEVFWEKIRGLDPILASQKEVKPLEFADLQALVDSPKTALLSFYSTNDSTYIFILRHQKSPTVHTCLKQGNANLQNWILDQWLNPYKESLEIWRNQIPEKLQELSQRLELQTLIKNHLQDIEELILIPHIFLHLIPFAALPINPETHNSELFGERFRLRYSFSGQVLHLCQQRQPKITSVVLDKTTGKILRLFHPYKHGTVEVASDDTPLASWLGEQLTEMFNIPNDRRLQGIDQATKDNYRQLLKNINIATNYHHVNSSLYKPLESALKLGDGSLTLGELMSPIWRMLELIEVFLCCCETNLGKPTVTDDIITIAAGFLSAGARSVISTLWSVDQLATAIFCIYYYECRKDPAVNRLTAIQLAQKKLREVSGKDLVEKFENYFEQAEARKVESINRGDKLAFTRYLQQEKAIFAEIQLLQKFPKNLNPSTLPTIGLVLSAKV